VTAGLRRFFVASASLTVTAIACGNLSPSSDVDPCTQLGEVCDLCKIPQDQQNCQAALAAADDAQCAAVLDSTGFQNDCQPHEGGTSTDAPVEAAPLPACGATATADAGCACSGGDSGSCSPSCSGGGCAFTCASGTCTPTCAGGHCTLRCESGATCESSCSGGDCIIQCLSGSQCANTCTGGGCSFQCEDDAICNDTCGSASGCVGM
jgi:hypothetical protein